jgi:hypothetical protein
MNEIAVSGDRRMTVKEVADALGVSADTIKISVREVYPGLMQNGVTTVLNEEQVTAVKMNLRKNSQVQNQPKTDLDWRGKMEMPKLMKWVRYGEKVYFWDKAGNKIAAFELLDEPVLEDVPKEVLAALLSIEDGEGIVIE